MIHLTLVRNRAIHCQKSCLTRSEFKIRFGQTLVLVSKSRIWHGNLFAHLYPALVEILGADVLNHGTLISFCILGGRYVIDRPCLMMATFARVCNEGDKSRRKRSFKIPITPVRVIPPKRNNWLLTRLQECPSRGQGGAPWADTSVHSVVTGLYLCRSFKQVKLKNWFVNPLIPPKT